MLRNDPTVLLDCREARSGCQWISIGEAMEEERYTQNGV